MVATASIGPRNFLRGNPNVRRARHSQKNKLQLGHGIFSVETVLPNTVLSLRYLGFNWATEFSPWKRRRLWRAADLARAELQLGHGIFSVETGTRTSSSMPAPVLQLGHGIFSVETLYRVIQHHPEEFCFNWATEFSPWKHLRE